MRSFKFDTNHDLCSSPQFFATITAAWTPVGHGLLSGYTSQAIPSLLKDPTPGLDITKDQAQWISSIVPLVAVVAAPLSSPMCSLLGRRKTMMVACIPTIIGWFLIAYANNYAMILSGRAIGSAMSAISLPASYTYVAEIASKRYRGFLGSLMSVGFMLGLVISYSLGSVMNWNWLALMSATIPMVQLIVLSVTNPSPRWLISRNRMDDAKSSLSFFRGGLTPHVECELKDCEHQFKVAQQDKYWERIKMMIYSAGNRKAIATCLGVLFFTVGSGYAVVNYHTKSILVQAKINFDTNLATIMIGSCQVVANIISAFIVDKLGRKTLLYISGSFVCIAQVLLGLYFHFEQHGADLGDYRWAPFAILMMFVFFLPLGWGSVSYILVSELVPTQIRTETSVLGGAWEQLLHFAVLRLHGSMCAELGPQYLHWGFSICCGFAVIFTFFCVPETSNKSLEEIETLFTHLRREAMDMIGDRAACRELPKTGPLLKMRLKQKPNHLTSIEPPMTEKPRRKKMSNPPEGFVNIDLEANEKS